MDPLRPICREFRPQPRDDLARLRDARRQPLPEIPRARTDRLVSLRHLVFEIGEGSLGMPQMLRRRLGRTATPPAPGHPQEGLRLSSSRGREALRSAEDSGAATYHLARRTYAWAVLRRPRGEGRSRVTPWAGLTPKVRTEDTADQQRIHESRETRRAGPPRQCAAAETRTRPFSEAPSLTAMRGAVISPSTVPVSPTSTLPADVMFPITLP